MEHTDFEQWTAREVARLMALVQAERRYYQEIVAVLPAPVVVVGHDGSVGYANRSFRSLFGLQAGDLRRISLPQLLPSPQLTDALAQIHVRRTVPPVVVNHGERTLRISMESIRDRLEDSKSETLLVIEDVTPPAAGAQPVVDRSVATTLSGVAALIWEANADTLAFESVWGDTAWLGYTPERWLGDPNFFEERIVDADRERTLALYKSIISSGGEATAEFRTKASDGRLLWCRETIRVAAPGAAPRMVRGVMADFTLRRSLEQQLRTSARSEALQGLSARLAHDINNPLMLISGYAEELLAALPDQNAARADAAEILAATNRISAVTKRLTEYGRPQANAATGVDVSAVVNACGQELVRIAGAGANIEIQTSDPLWAQAGREQLAEVILALAAGVREGAIERTKVSVSCFERQLNESVSGPIEAGKYACIRIQDDGRGLDAKRGASIFEDVLGTKDGGDKVRSGAGGALPRAYRLVREWGGDIAVESAVGQGTTFTIFLPWTEAPLIPATTPATLPEPEPAPQTPAERLRETVLVVDDEAGIRGLMRKILRREGYRVLEAGSAEEALTIAVSHGNAIQLLLTDVMLPGMSGPDLARRMFESSPSLKVLYISGYTGDEAVRRGEYPPGAQFLAKPFTLGALVSGVRNVLDA